MLSFEIAAEVNREQIKDHIRRAAREHLVQQAMAANKKSPIWHSIKEQLAQTLEKWQSNRDESSDEAYSLSQS